MKKIINIIQKSYRIKNKLKKIVGGKRNENHKNYDHHHDIELDDHNDSSNWSYC